MTPHEIVAYVQSDDRSRMTTALNNFIPTVRNAWITVHNWESWGAVPATIEDVLSTPSRDGSIALQALTRGTLFGQGAETTEQLIIPLDSILREIASPNNAPTAQQQDEIDQKLALYPEADRAAVAAITYILNETATIYTQFCCTHLAEDPDTIVAHIQQVQDVMITSMQRD